MTAAAYTDSIQGRWMREFDDLPAELRAVCRETGDDADVARDALFATDGNTARAARLMRIWAQEDAAQDEVPF